MNNWFLWLIFGLAESTDDPIKCKTDGRQLQECKRDDRLETDKNLKVPKAQLNIVLPFLVNDLQWTGAFWGVWLWLWWTDADSSTSLIRVTLTLKSL